MKNSRLMRQTTDFGSLEYLEYVAAISSPCFSMFFRCPAPPPSSTSGCGTARHRRWAMAAMFAMFGAMSVEPGQDPEPLPPMLLKVWPVIALGAMGWLIAAAAAFLVPALGSWRPVILAGLGTGLLGTGIFVWQRTAARRGARGAQTGLEIYLDPK